MPFFVARGRGRMGISTQLRSRPASTLKDPLAHAHPLSLSYASPTRAKNGSPYPITRVQCSPHSAPSTLPTRRARPPHPCSLGLPHARLSRIPCPHQSPSTLLVDKSAASGHPPPSLFVGKRPTGPPFPPSVPMPASSPARRENTPLQSRSKKPGEKHLFAERSRPTQPTR